MLKRKSMLLSLAVTISALVLISCGTEVTHEPPVAKTIPKVDTLFGHEMTDNYFWLRDRDNPEVIDYLKAENAFTEVIMKPTEKLQDKLYNEMVGRIKEDDSSVPAKRDNYYYYSRTEEDKQYRIYCRKESNLDSKEEILLDINRLAEGKDYMRLGAYEISPDHKLLAYAIDDKGNERYTLYVKNLENGQLLDDVLENISTSVEWANDDKTLFYLIRDDVWRPHKLFRHTLGSDFGKDVMVYHEPDDAFWMGITKTKSMDYLLLGIGSSTTSEYHYLKADNPTGQFKVIHPRQHEMEYNVDQRGNKFYILTNDSAKNFRLMETPVAKTSKKYWKEIIPHRDSVKIDGIELFRDHLVLYLRENGLTSIWIKSFENNQTHFIEFDEPVYTVEDDNNPDFNTNILRFNYVSMITPNSIYDYNMNTRKRELKKQREVLGGFNPSDYQSERVFAVAEDGTRIPISMVYRKGMVKNAHNPLYLYGYGSYGSCFDPWFSSNRISILDRGFIFAIAHVRGGGVMGRHWYDDGKLLKKKNTFTDFIACAEYLISKKYTCSDLLTMTGASAGGLLAGVVANMRPDLFKVIVADVPFVDLINTMMDESIPLTVIEYEEWGNPNERGYFDYMLSYSPYDNVEVKNYPNMLITAGLNDPRVQYWESAKWTAKLRTMKTDSNRLLLKTNMGAGHGGASGRYDSIKELAFEYAFIFDILGIKE